MEKKKYWSCKEVVNELYKETAFKNIKNLYQKVYAILYNASPKIIQYTTIGPHKPFSSYYLK